MVKNNASNGAHRLVPLHTAASTDSITASLGNEPALIGGSGKRAPDRRRVSLRWLSGSILTGVTSVLLMGGALNAALDGRQQLAIPANFMEGLVSRANQTGAKQAVKGDRPISLVAVKPVNEKILQVPTVTREGTDNVIRKRPFAYASAPLAVAPQPGFDYPAFNALTVFRSSGSDNPVASSDVIYGADVESEVRIQTVAFPLDTAQYDASTRLSAKEAEQIVREAKASLTGGETQVTALAYLDDTRFQLEAPNLVPTTGPDIKIEEANVSVTALDEPTFQISRSFEEEVISVSPNQSMEAALDPMDFEQAPLKPMVEAMESELGTGAMDSGTKLRVTYEETEDPSVEDGKRRSPRRISVYRAGKHIKSVAMSDENSVVWASAPSPIPATNADDPNDATPKVRMVSRKNLPNIYDGVYRAALSQGLSKSHARRIIRTIAFDVDFKQSIKSTDDLEVFYSMEDGAESATSDSEILYIGLNLGDVKRTYYRFRSEDDGRVDFYDATGKSAKKFLLRKPVPNARFGSSFGRRRHPISRTYKMHWGVDFSAPRGTPILSAGNGVVEQAKWNAGYGRQVIIRHANGYKTSYSHMHRFAKGIRVGARVRQGQIIGQVGSTGYSTGPHLHYEVKVNGNKVNPMKIRLPKGRVLQGAELAAFKRERDRINALLEKGRGGGDQIAALN